MQCEDQGFEPFRFAILTDLHLLKRGMDKTRKAIEDINGRPNLAFVLLLGDFIWPGPMAELKAVFSRIRLPYHAVPGNHDAARIGEYADEFGPLYEAFEHRGCLFIGLWNGVPALRQAGARHGELDPDQEAWLVETLRRAQKRRPSYRRIFLYAHVPPLPAGGSADPEFRMTPALSGRFYEWCRQFHVDACFFGHVHYDEAFEHDGTCFITTPSLIWNLDRSAGPDAESWTKTDRGGYQIVRVGRDAIRGEIQWI